MPSDPDRTVRLAARAMGRNGLAHAFGHVSCRLDEERFLVSPARPLGAVASGARGIEVLLHEPLHASVLGEVRLHREIYLRRRDVGGICRVQPPCLMALSVLGRTPRALNGSGSYFAPAPPIWNTTALIRDDETARAVADMLGQARAIVLRGNGAVVTGSTLEEASANAFFLEDAARVELAVLPVEAAGMNVLEFSPKEAEARAVSAGGIYERAWEYLCLGDDELEVAA